MSLIESNWVELWQKLADNSAQTRKERKVSRYETHFRRKSKERPDPLLDFVLQNLSSQSTFLDIGVGSGRWAIPVAKVARSVTAVEPSEAMIDILQEKITAAELSNINIVKSRWENADVEPHDIVSCVHAVYESNDLTNFVRKMDKHARERCYLVLRFPPHDGIISELSVSIYGHPYDSPNAIIAFNALYSLGIYANVLVENNILHWVDSTFEEAFNRAKGHLHLEYSTVYDELIRNTLTRRLTVSNNNYIWPDGMRSALLWWGPTLKNL